MGFTAIALYWTRHGPPFAPTWSPRRPAFPSSSQFAVYIVERLFVYADFDGA